MAGCLALTQAQLAVGTRDLLACRRNGWLAYVRGRHAGAGCGQRTWHVGPKVRADAMRPLRWQVAVVAAAGLALALETLPTVLRWLWVRRRRRPRREVLFFPSQVTCTEALLRSPGATPSGCPCSLPHGESSLSRLLSALLAARVSLELCLFAFSSPQLGRAVQLLHQRGVRVRVVTDCDYMALNGSQIGLLRKAGRPGAGPREVEAGLRGAWGSVGGLGRHSRPLAAVRGVQRSFCAESLARNLGMNPRGAEAGSRSASKAFQGPRSLCRAQVCRDAASA